MTIRTAAVQPPILGKKKFHYTISIGVHRNEIINLHKNLHKSLHKNVHYSVKICVIYTRVYTTV